MIKLTNKQSKARNTMASSLVSASAGTGKTTVITERVIKLLLEDKVDVSNILLMTFSNASAKEMKDRVRDRLNDVINDENEAPLKKRIAYHQAKRIGDSSIQTIHSFCNDVMKDHYYTLGLSSSYKVLSEAESYSMKLDVAEDVLAPYYSSGNLDFLRLYRILEGMSPMEKEIISIHNDIRSMKDGMNWFNSEIDKYANAAIQEPAIFAESMKKDIQASLNAYEELLNAMRVSTHPKIAKPLECVQAEYIVVRDLLSSIERTNSVLAMDLSDLEVLKQRATFDKEIHDLRDARNYARNILLDKYYDKNDHAFIEELIKTSEMFPVLKVLQDIITDFDKEYSRRKLKVDKIDYADMEIKALEILEDEEILEQYRKQFNFIFVDEYQDTNPVQEELVRKLSVNNNLFTVGDLKQSIYRFRHSDPLLFSERERNYRGGLWKGDVLTLNENFRSSRSVLEGTNDLFETITKLSEEIEYGPDQKLIPMRKEPTVTPVTVLEPKNLTLPGLSQKEIDALAVASKIQEIVGAEIIFDPKENKYRKVEYKDIAILSRNSVGVGEILREALSANGIPYKSDNKSSLYTTIEAELISNFLRLGVSFDDDIALMSIIRYGAFGLNDDDLLSLRLDTESETLTDAVIEVTENKIGNYNKFENLLSFIKTIQDMNTKTSVSEIVSFIVDEINLAEVAMIQDYTGQKLSNVKNFEIEAGQFTIDTNKGISEFLSYIEGLKKNNVNVDGVDVFEEADAVLITTIHKSKGMEYPVVFVPFLGDSFSTSDSRKPIVFDQDAGLGIRYISDDLEKKDLLLKDLVTSHMGNKSREEEMRLLYVAMTRAKDALFLVGKSDKKPVKRLDDVKSYMDLIDYFKENAESDYIVYEEYGNNFVKPSITKIVNRQKGLETKPNVDLSFIEIQKDFRLDSKAPVSLSASKIGIDNTYSNSLLKGLDEKATYKGDVIHMIMKHIDFNSVKANGAEKAINELVEGGIITNEELKLIKGDIQSIERFFSGDLGQMILNSDNVFRETSLAVKKPAKDLGYNEDEDILVRCVVDIVFEYEGKWFIADYKSDTLSSKTQRSLNNKVSEHKPQLQIYKEAFEYTFGENVSGLYLSLILENEDLLV